MEQKPLPDFRAARTDAGVILSKNGNRLKLMEGIAVCLLPVFLSVVLAELFQSVVGLATEKESVLFFAEVAVFCFSALFQLFFTLPLFAGLLGMAAGMARGEAVLLTDLFEPFSGKSSYRRALGLVVRPFLFTVGMVIVVRWTAGIFGAVGGAFWVAFLAAVVIVAEVILWLRILARGFFAALFVCFCGMPAADAWWKNDRMAGTAKRGGTVWLLCNLPRILLGLLTVGILLLADVFPRMCVSYFLYAGRMTDAVNSSEGTNHE